MIVLSVSDLSVCRVLPEPTPTTFLRDSLLTWHLPVMSLEMRLWVALYTMIIESIWEIRRPFIKIIDKDDFDDMFGANILLFRKDLDEKVRDKVYDLYVSLARALTATGQEALSSIARAYVELILTPNRFGEGDRRWSFVPDSISAQRLLSEEMSAGNSAVSSLAREQSRARAGLGEP